jgi:hypothetical protein
MPSVETSAPTPGVVPEVQRGINVAGVMDRLDDLPGWSVRADDLASAAASFTVSASR